jgi:predicted nucleotidyltransferase
MDINRIKQPLNRFIQKASQSIQVEEVIIFGSYLEGNATKDSDLDLLVISEDFKTLDEDKRSEILYAASSQIEPDIHPWGLTREELQKASKLTLMGYARDNGIHFNPLIL